MAKTNKDRIKRTIAQAVNLINSAGIYISQVDDLFSPVHPELAEGLKACLGLLNCSLEVLDSFAYASWGVEHPDWEQWRMSTSSGDLPDAPKPSMD